MSDLVNVSAVASIAGINGRPAIVTGAACGIGRSIAEQLAVAGAEVVATDKDVHALAHPFIRAVETMRLDLGADNIAASASQIVDRFGLPELIVNNVGITTPHRFLELTEDDFELVFRTNLRGPWFFTKRILQELVDRGLPGSVVFISSLHDHRIRRYPHYSASKAAVTMLVRELAYDLAPHGIRVNAVSPGWVPHDTPPETNSRRVPLGRPGTPEDVASMVLYLLSDRLAGYVTGVNVPIDGGLDLYNWLLD